MVNLQKLPGDAERRAIEEEGDRRRCRTDVEHNVPMSTEVLAYEYQAMSNVRRLVQH